MKKASKNSSWNLPLLAANKPAKEKDEPNNIKVYLDARFLNDKIVEMSDNNLLLLRDVG
jgi:hypothetical protein